MAYIPGRGTLLKKGTTTIGQRVTITASQSMGSVECTHLDSVTKEFRSTILDTGEVQCDVEFDPNDDSHQEVEEAATSGDTEEWSIVVPTTVPTIYTFDAFVTDFELNGIEVEGNLTSSFTLKRTGPVVKTGGGEGGGV